MIRTEVWCYVREFELTSLGVINLMGTAHAVPAVWGEARRRRISTLWVQCSLSVNIEA